jgi:hypothetical protein
MYVKHPIRRLRVWVCWQSLSVFVPTYPTITSKLAYQSMCDVRGLRLLDYIFKYCTDYYVACIVLLGSEFCK